MNNRAPRVYSTDVAVSPYETKRWQLDAEFQKYRPLGQISEDSVSAPGQSEKA